MDKGLLISRTGKPSYLNVLIDDLPSKSHLQGKVGYCTELDLSHFPSVSSASPSDENLLLSSAKKSYYLARS